MIGDQWTFWESLFFGFAALGAAVLYIVLEYWPQLLMLALLIVGIKISVRATRRL